MRKVFRLIRLEVRLLGRTIVLMGLILMTFVAALLSVISVLLDLPQGLYEGYNEYNRYFALTVNDYASVPVECAGTAKYGKIEGITVHSVLSGATGSISLTPSQKVDKDKPLEGAELSLNAVAILPSALSIFDGYESMLYKGSRLPSAPGEIVINRDVAAMVGAKLGDTVTLAPDPEWADEIDFTDIEPRTYTLVGVISPSTVTSVSGKHLRDPNFVLPTRHIYLVDEDLTSRTFFYEDSRVFSRDLKALQRDKHDITTDSTITDTISVAQAFFGAISGVLGAMVVFIIYSLIHIFFRQRKTQICRLKLLGATDGLIAETYCMIAIMLVLVSVIFGSLLAMAFNVYFMDLCGSLFNRISSNFVSHFRPIIQLIVFAVMAAFTLLIYALSNRKLRDSAIVQEVRHE